MILEHPTAFLIYKNQCVKAYSIGEQGIGYSLHDGEYEDAYYTVNSSSSGKSLLLPAGAEIFENRLGSYTVKMDRSHWETPDLVERYYNRPARGEGVAAAGAQIIDYGGGHLDFDDWAAEHL